MCADAGAPTRRRYHGGMDYSNASESKYPAVVTAAAKIRELSEEFCQQRINTPHSSIGEYLEAVSGLMDEGSLDQAIERIGAAVRTGDEGAVVAIMLAMFTELLETASVYE